MFDTNYLVEILSSRRTDTGIDKSALNRFAKRNYRVLDSGMGISVPDNPMGQPRCSLVEMIAQAGLPVISQATGKTIPAPVAINTANQAFWGLMA